MLQAIAVFIQFSFYSFYVAKILIQRRQAIQTNQMGRGNKPKKVLRIERITLCATVLALLGSVGSIFFTKPQPSPAIATIGVAVGVFSVVFFAAATLTMKTSWRVGIPQEKTELVTEGVYRISRNPAFVGFDLLYLSTCPVFPNLTLILICLWAGAMLHLQILQEEAHLRNTFGEEYDAYVRQALRYLGRRRGA